ncbi:restriction endonuclease-like protein [Zhaonella formicivorans]|uniref:restriction endonuclease-like protein n=1 Tax=Zhaonella formicivorans TaxID=2528593 RepID=UPI0010CF4267|nr:restriction endonuclease-like protein [Zhaonella formicivorans]
MALPRSGSLKESVELLRVETDLFDLYIKGKPFHPTVEALHLHRRPEEEWVEATLEVIPVPSLSVTAIKIFSPARGEMVDLGEEPIKPCFYENQNYEFVIQKKTDKLLTFYHENINLRQTVKPLGPNLLVGVLNFQNEVGYTDLEIRLMGQPVLNLRLEIFPSKMDYQKDYRMILQEVHEQVYNLAFDFLRKTYQLTGLRETQHPSLTEFFTILTSIFRQLIGAVERIQAVPHHRLIPVQEFRRVEQVKRAGKANLTYLAKHSHLLVQDEKYGVLSIQGQTYRPIRLIETGRRIDFDTVENRFLNWMILRIISKLKDLRRRVLSRERVSDPLLLRRIDGMLTQLTRLANLDFLRGVGEMKQISLTLVLQMAPGYRDVYRFYLILMKGLSIQGDLFRLSLKDLAQLYEYWCFLKIHSLLKQKYELIRQDIIRVQRNGLFVTLDRSQKASVTYRNPHNGELFTLFYNALPTEDSAHIPTLPQRPDNVLALKKENSTVEYKYIFDAKYRLNPAYEGSSYALKYGSPGPEEEDINTMHRYRDAIVYENSSGEFERSMFGAYVLFPYPDEEKFREHRFYKSIKKVNVGALPFLPHATKLMEEFLDELILDSPEKAYERSTRPRGTDEYFANKLQGKNVLIGSMRDKKQLPLCLEHQVYWIPLKRLTQQQSFLSELQYIGLYQSRHTFGPKESGIHWIGKIKSWQVVRRYEIKYRRPLPGTENELYVLFQIEAWQKRPVPIKPGGYGIYTHLFTSLYMLERAEEIAELKLETEEQLKEWREKRRIGKVQVELDDEYVDRAREVLKVEVDGPGPGV